MFRLLIDWGYRIILRFILSQHSRDEQLMRSLIEYLDCENVYLSKEAIAYQVYKLSDINNKIISFFNKYPILGVKSLDFNDFCKVNEIMQEKGQGYGEQGPLLLRKKYPLLPHLTKEGLDRICKIKAGMNKERDLGRG